MKVHPAKTNYVVNGEFATMYERIVTLTCGSSHVNPHNYHIYPKCNVTLNNDKLVYYIYEITGDLGENAYGDGYFTDPFKIVISNGDLIAIVGDLQSLFTVLDILEEEGNEMVSILEYKRIYCPFIDEVLHQWIMKGCPEIGLSYRLNINQTDNTLSILMISAEYIIINFLGSHTNFINIIHNNTDERWIFTRNSPTNPTSCFYKTRSSCSQPMTPDLTARAVILICPIENALFTCYDT